MLLASSSSTQPPQTSPPSSNPSSSRVQSSYASPSDSLSRPSLPFTVTSSSSSPSTPSSSLCARCHLPLDAPTIRAMDKTFHKSCFVCADCGNPVGERFFPLDQPPSSPLPLCELDFFRRRSLLCHVCGGALRGDYVMAVGHKYHLEHFTCSICPRVFQADDNYYERDGSVYCHFHFSTLFADRCEGCNSAILRQFIENLRNGRHEHWHPECYMIHKFWNVRLAAESAPPASAATDPGPYVWKDDSDLTPDLLKAKQSAVENKVFRIWTVLSEYEEVSAACISDMLQYATASSTLDAVLATSRLIYRVQVLFSAIDLLRQNPTVARSLGKEPKTLCKNIVNFLTTLPGSVLSPSSAQPATSTPSPPSSVAAPSSSKDLLDLVTSMAHYLKLLIQFGLDSALLQDRLDSDSHAVESFLDYLSSHNSPPVLSRATLVPNITDQCMSCRRGIEEKCARLLPSADSGDRRDRRWHLTAACFACAKCQRSLVDDLARAVWSSNLRVVLCTDCATAADQPRTGFEFVSRLNQYSFLLKVALQRVYKTVETLAAQGPLKRISSTDKHESVVGYVNTLTDIRRLRSTRFKRAISDAKGKQVRRSKSTMGNESQRASASPKSQSQSPQGPSTGSLQRRKSSRTHSSTTVNANSSSSNVSREIVSPPSSIATAPSTHHHSTTSLLNNPDTPPSAPRRTNTASSDKPDILFGEKYLTLDDIPRIVAAEQAREQRPNAFRHQRQSSLKLGSGPAPKLMLQQLPVSQSHVGPAPTDDRGTTSPRQQQQSRPQQQQQQQQLQQLQQLQPQKQRQTNAVQLAPKPSTDDTTPIARSIAPNSSEKMKRKGSANAAANAAAAAAANANGVFKVGLDALVERSGTDSELGVSAGMLKVPAFLDDVISAMRRKDMSVEGVFRKNGNIRKLKALAETIDKSGASSSTRVNLDTESPVQLAALLKKFLREMPDPLLTFKLYRIWVASQKIGDDETRRRVLHLCCCLLPRSHRDSMEILLNFLKWVASFSHVDEESGSKMDIHNLSTVITPNILYSQNAADEDTGPIPPPQLDPETGEQVYFLAIEAVNSLIENQDEFSLVPEDILDDLEEES
ncbi:rho-type GTPase-activating protein 1 [Myxozyma melibiosi]|uniref:Rho-type GTPase-activating protein 1 n=1 Tax=Myxozyma melibiosi TaxID=54550 RepID=A0ABR1F125_9ASCO